MGVQYYLDYKLNEILQTNTSVMVLRFMSKILKRYVTELQLIGRNYLLAGVNDGESWKEALGYGLLDDLEWGADECLTRNDGCQCSKDPHWIESPIWQWRPKTCTELIWMLCQICCLQYQPEVCTFERPSKTNAYLTTIPAHKEIQESHLALKSFALLDQGFQWSGISVTKRLALS